MPSASTHQHQIAIIIPARYHSSRLPGKPLAVIAGHTMLSRVWSIAQHLVNQYTHRQDVNIQTHVTTEDSRIVNYCLENGISCIMTSETCRSGTERVAEACNTLDQQPEFILNLQGDNALCPPWFLSTIIDQYLLAPSKAIITPYVQLTWDALDQLKKDKQETPFSGTTVVFNSQREAFWFSKNIIPAIRKEEALRNTSELSPIARHIGLYGYDKISLEQILTLPETNYESLEGLEQLSFLEAGIPIKMVEVGYKGRQGMTGIDSPTDIARAEAIIQKDGELELL